MWHNLGHVSSPQEGRTLAAAHHDFLQSGGTHNASSVSKESQNTMGEVTMNCPECGVHMTKNAFGKMACNCGYVMNSLTSEVPMVLTDKQRREAVGYLTANCDCYKGKEKVLLNREVFSDDDLNKIVENAKKTAADALVANAARRGVKVLGSTITFNAEGRPVLNAKAEGSNADVADGPVSVDADGGSEEPQEKVDSSVEGDKDVGDTIAKKTALNAADWARKATDVPEAVRNSILRLVENEERDKQQIIERLVVNVGDAKVRARLVKRYSAMDIADLKDEAAARHLPMQMLYNREERREPVYGAAPQQPAPTGNADGEPDLLVLPTMNWGKKFDDVPEYEDSAA